MFLVLPLLQLSSVSVITLLQTEIRLRQIWDSKWHCVETVWICCVSLIVSCDWYNEWQFLLLQTEQTDNNRRAHVYTHYNTQKMQKSMRDNLPHSTPPTHWMTGSSVAFEYMCLYLWFIWRPEAGCIFYMTQWTTDRECVSERESEYASLCVCNMMTAFSLHRLLSKSVRNATSEMYLKIKFMALLMYHIVQQ